MRNIGRDQSDRLAHFIGRAGFAKARGIACGLAPIVEALKA